MDVQTIAAIVFIILLSYFLYVKRKKLVVQKIAGPFLYFVLYKTKKGLKFMDRTAKKFSTTIKYLGYAGIIIGFLGMALICYELTKSFFNTLLNPDSMPGVGIVLPIEAKGVFYVPFFYWIISIFIIAVVHEFSHGIMARRYKMKVKSSGFAFLGILLPIIPAAFVEPDEKKMKKCPKVQQLSVFAAGPFSNILLGFFFLLIMALVAGPVVDSIIDYTGVKVTGYSGQNMSAELAGIPVNSNIISIDNDKVDSILNFTRILDQKKPGDVILVGTLEKSYEVTLSKNPENESRAYLGVFVTQSTEISPKAKEMWILPYVAIWLLGLVYWLYVLNLGIGLFNLVPLGPIDGGRMLHLALDSVFGKARADKYWKVVSFIFLAMILVIIVSPFFR